MTETPSIFLELPSNLEDAAISLRTDAASLWPSIKKISDPELTEMLNYWNWPLEKNLARFRDKDYYCTDFLDYQKSNEEKYALRLYWVCNAAKQIVGYLNIATPKGSNDTFSIGCYILSNHRKKNYATAALEVITDYALGQDIAAYVCAECEPDQTLGAKILAKNGFKKYGQGVCTTSSIFAGATLDRFLKTKGPEYPCAWPILSPS